MIKLVVMIKRSYDVAVVGAGPAGLSVAANLSKRGYSVILIEKKRRLGTSPFACLVTARSLKELGLDKSARFLEGSLDCVEINMHEEGSFRIKKKFVIVEKQTLLEEAATHIANMGADIAVASSLADVKREREGLSLSLKGSMLRASIDTRLLIESYGLSDDVPKDLSDDVPKSLRVYLTDCSASANNCSAAVYLSPVSKGTCFVLSVIRPGKVSLVSNSLEKLKAYMLKGTSYQVGYIPLEPISKPYRNRLLKLGDAAGLGYGMVDGFEAACVSGAVASDTISKFFEEPDANTDLASYYLNRLKSELSHTVPLAKALKMGWEEAVKTVKHSLKSY